MHLGNGSRKQQGFLGPDSDRAAAQRPLYALAQPVLTSTPVSRALSVAPIYGGGNKPWSGKVHHTAREGQRWDLNPGSLEPRANPCAALLSVGAWQWPVDQGKHP